MKHIIFSNLSLEVKTYRGDVPKGDTLASLKRKEKEMAKNFFIFISEYRAREVVDVEVKV